MPLVITADEVTRALGGAQRTISEFVHVSVDGAEDNADGDKSISDLVLKKSEAKSIEIQINFANREALTQYIAEPDILVVKISLPQYFKDSETG